MSVKIDFIKIFYGSIIYGTWSILLGFFVLDLAPYAAIISALGAGIYVGRKCNTVTAITSGLLTGLVGGILTGILSMNINNIAGIPLSITVANFLSPIVSSISPSSILFPTTALALIGLVFGGIGGLLGSIEKLRGIFLFLALFFLFIIYGAVDNAAWNLFKPGWTWNMSFSHVLTNQIDLFVAIVYSLGVTILIYIMNLFK